MHTGRSARSHLRTMAATHNIKASRVSEVIEMTGLAGVATKRVGGFSLGMGQRLGIAAALLGDPRTLILDEPVNGLDPEGVQLVRQLVRALAAQGRPTGNHPRRATEDPRHLVRDRHRRSWPTLRLTTQDSDATTPAKAVSRVPEQGAAQAGSAQAES